MDKNNLYIVQCRKCGIKPVKRNSSDWRTIKISGKEGDKILYFCPKCFKKLKYNVNVRQRIEEYGRMATVAAFKELAPQRLKMSYEEYIEELPAEAKDAYRAMHKLLAGREC